MKSRIIISSVCPTEKPFQFSAFEIVLFELFDMINKIMNFLHISLSDEVEENFKTRIKICIFHIKKRFNDRKAEFFSMTEQLSRQTF